MMVITGQFNVNVIEDAVIDKKSVDSFCQHQVEHLKMTNLKQLDSAQMDFNYK